jgi:hypothetical protein
MNSSEMPEESPGLEGPDYVALVIEWDDYDADTMVRAREPARTPLIRRIATVAGALVAIVVATWGLRRLRTS